MRISKTRALLAGAAVAALIAPLGMSAGAASGAATRQLRIQYNLSLGDYAGPLQFAKYGPHTYVADSFTSHLWEIGVSKPLATGPNPRRGGDIAGVAVNTDNGDVAYTTTDFAHHIARLIVLHNGQRAVVATIRSFEWRNNPDKSTIYGLLDPARDQCAADTLSAHHIPVRYTGGVDSHPYAVAYIGGGSWAVADAGGNDILRVGPQGNVSLIKVIGHQPLRITADFAHAQHLADCAIGKTYYTESVPTDVEMGPDGLLYVSTLPGGPEDPSLPPRGNVYTINPNTLATHLIGQGFADPTNLAVRSTGTVYVAEPFLGRVTTLVGGGPSTRMSLIGAAGLEVANGKLYVSTAPGLVGSSKPTRVSQLVYR